MPRSLLIPVLAFGLAGCASNFTLKKDIVFKSVGDASLKGDVYQPPGAGKHPAVVVVHGGGWSRRSGAMHGICEQLANEGFVVFNITYRLAPKAHFPAPMEDVRDGIQWFHDHAADYNADPDKMAGWGYSAGSQLLMLASLDGKLGLKAVVAGSSPTDLTAWPKSPLVFDLLGLTYAENPELWRSASPIFNVTDKSPPLFMYYGAWDHLVEPEQTAKMVAAMELKNRPVASYKVNYMGHFTVYLLSQESVDRGIAFIKEHL
jgi:acetyl esterase/lipase